MQILSFKIYLYVYRCENQFKNINNDLVHKVEEKTNTIKSLSKQLSSYESNLNEIKYELNSTKAKQGELDDVYSNCMKDIDYLIKTFSLKDDENQSFKFKQNNLLKASSNGSLISSINILKGTLEEYKKNASQIFDQVRFEICIQIRLEFN